MSANLVGGERFLTKFQFHEGIHPFNTPPSMAGALVTMSWNEAVIAQGRGWGVIVQGRRPHHARPHLLEKNLLSRAERRGRGYDELNKSITPAGE